MATFYLRNDGTAPNKGAAVGPISDPSKCMNVAVHNSQTFNVGDKIIVGDQGGMITSMIVAPSNGVTYTGTDNLTKIVGGAINPTFTKAGDIYSADITGTVFDVFVYSGGLKAEYPLTRNTTAPNAIVAGEWSQIGSKLNVRLLDDSDPKDSIWVVTTPQVFNVVGKTDVVIEGFNIPFSAYYDWHGHLGGIVFNNGCTNCQVKNITASYCQHALTIYSRSTDCLAEQFTVSDCYSAGVAIAQGFANQHNTGSILRNSTFTRCGLEGGGAFAVVAHGAADTGLVKNALIDNIVVSQGDTNDVWGHGISTWHSDGVTISNSKITGFNRNGKDGITAANTANNTTFKNNTILDCYNGIQYHNNSLVVGNLIKDSKYCSIRANSASGSIVNNTLDPNNRGNGYPIGIWNSNFTHVSNNIYLNGRYAVRDMTANSTVTNFTNNISFNCRDAATISSITNSSGNRDINPGSLRPVTAELYPGSAAIGTGIRISDIHDTWIDKDGNTVPATPNIGASQFVPDPIVPAELTVYVDTNALNDNGDGLTLATAKKYVSSGLDVMRNDTSNAATKKLVIIEGNYSNHSRNIILINKENLNNLTIEGIYHPTIAANTGSTFYCMKAGLNVKVKDVLFTSGVTNQTVCRSTVDSTVDFDNVTIVAPRGHENRNLVDVSNGEFNLNTCKIYSSEYLDDPKNAIIYSGNSHGKIINTLIVPAPHAAYSSTVRVDTVNDVLIQNSVILGSHQNAINKGKTGTITIRDSIVGAGIGSKDAYAIAKTNGTINIGNSYLIPNPLDPSKVTKGNYNDLGGNIIDTIDPKFKNIERKGYFLPSICGSENIDFAISVEQTLKSRDLTATYFSDTATVLDASKLKGLVSRGTFEVGSFTHSRSSLFSTSKIWDVVKGTETLNMDREANTLYFSGGSTVNNFRSKTLEIIKQELEGFGATVTPTANYSTTPIDIADSESLTKVYHLTLGESIKLNGNAVEILDDPTGNTGFYKVEMKNSKDTLESTIGDTIDSQIGSKYTCNSLASSMQFITTNAREAATKLGYTSFRASEVSDKFGSLGTNVASVDIFKIFDLSTELLIGGPGKNESQIRADARALALAFANSGLVTSFSFPTKDVEKDKKLFEWVIDEFSKLGDKIKICSQQIFTNEIKKKWNLEGNYYSKPYSILDEDYSLENNSPLLIKGIGLIQEIPTNVLLRWSSVSPINSAVGKNPISTSIFESSPDGLPQGSTLKFESENTLSANGTLVVKFTPTTNNAGVSTPTKVFGPLEISNEGLILNDGTSSATDTVTFNNTTDISAIIRTTFPKEANAFKKYDKRNFYLVENMVSNRMSFGTPANINQFTNTGYFAVCTGNTGDTDLIVSNTITGNTDISGLGTNEWKAVVEYQDGSLEFNIVKVNGSNIILSYPLTKNGPVKVWAAWEAANGQHYSLKGVACLAEKLVNLDAREAVFNETVYSHLALDGIGVKPWSKINDLYWKPASGLPNNMINLSKVLNPFSSIAKICFNSKTSSVLITAKGGQGADLTVPIRKPFTGRLELITGINSEVQESGTFTITTSTGTVYSKEFTNRAYRHVVYLNEATDIYLKVVRNGTSTETTNIALGELHLIPNVGISRKLFKNNSKILLLGDSWMDNKHVTGKGFEQKLKELLPEATITNGAKQGMTTNYGISWLPKLITDHSPDVCVINFFTNDNNNQGNTTYLDPNGESQLLNVHDHAKWAKNIDTLINICVEANVIPIVMLPDGTGSESQTIAHCKMALELQYPVLTEDWLTKATADELNEPRSTPNRRNKVAGRTLLRINDNKHVCTMSSDPASSWSTDIPSSILTLNDKVGIPFDGTYPELSLGDSAPVKLKEIQVWSNNPTLEDIETLPIVEPNTPVILKWSSINPGKSVIGSNPSQVSILTTAPDGLVAGQELSFASISDLNNTGSLVIRIVPTVEPSALATEKQIFGPVYLVSDGIVVKDGTNTAKLNCIWEKDEELTILVRIKNGKISVGKVVYHGKRVEQMRSGKKLFSVAYIDPAIPIQQNQEEEVAKFPLILVPQDIRSHHVKWRDKIRGFNPNIVMLAYQMTIEEITVPGPGHDIMRAFGDHAWVLDPDGVPYSVEISPGKFRKMYDPRTPGWKEMIVEACGVTLKSYDYDGLFLDQCTIFRKVAPDTGTFNSMMEALRDTLQAIRKAYPNVILVGNSKYHWPMLNGQMNENRPTAYNSEFGPDKKLHLPKVNLAAVDVKDREQSEIVGYMNQAQALGAYFTAFTNYQTANYWPYYG